MYILITVKRMHAPERNAHGIRRFTRRLLAIARETQTANWRVASVFLTVERFADHDRGCRLELVFVTSANWTNILIHDYIVLKSIKGDSILVLTRKMLHVSVLYGGHVKKPGLSCLVGDPIS